MLLEENYLFKMRLKERKEHNKKYEHYKTKINQVNRSELLPTRPRNYKTHTEEPHSSQRNIFEFRRHFSKLDKTGNVFSDSRSAIKPVASEEIHTPSRNKDCNTNIIHGQMFGYKEIYKTEASTSQRRSEEYSKRNTNEKSSFKFDTEECHERNKTSKSKQTEEYLKCSKWHTSKEDRKEYSRRNNKDYHRRLEDTFHKQTWTTSSDHTSRGRSPFRENYTKRKRYSRSKSVSPSAQRLDTYYEENVGRSGGKYRKRRRVCLSLQRQGKVPVDTLDEVTHNKHVPMRKRDVKMDSNDEKNISDFRKISIIPNCEDLHGKLDPMLRPNKIKGAYSDLYDYLDVQFRLLREDFVHPLRESIRAHTRMNTDKNKKKIKEIKIYENVQIVSPFYDDGLNYILSFNISKLRHIRWNMTDRLMYGNLVCLSSDNFQTCYFAVIVRRDAKNLRQGRLNVKFPFSWDLAKTLLGSTFTMIETTAYFEAYRPVLESLQRIKDGDLPFERYLVKCETSIAAPEYLREQTESAIFDLQCLVEPDSKVAADSCFKDPRSRYCKRSDIFERKLDCVINLFDKSWTIENKLKLDSSQLSALKSALTREISIIQGPPGCGKTYVGLQIAKALLHNIHSFRCTSINRSQQLIVVCYTNHALDQFIEGIRTFFEGDILRVGSRCSNENLKDCTLSAVRDKFRKTRAFPKSIYQSRILATSDFRMLKKPFHIKTEKIKILKQNIVSEEYLYDEMGELYEQFNRFSRKPKPPWLKFLGNSLMVEWLEIETMAKKIQSDIRFNNNEAYNYDENDDAIHIKERETVNDVETEFRTEMDKDDLQKLTHFRSKHIALDLGTIKMVNNDKIREEKTILVQQIKYMLLKASTANISKDKLLNIFCLPTEKKWALYWHWVKKKCEKLTLNFGVDLETLQVASERLKETLLMENEYLFHKAHVIGMTTTGAANYQTILQEMKPTIMIVEEAAEVLESHLVSNLASGCQQLILIGDHKQLKPKPNVYKLETKYNMAVSLFERMICNGIPHNCLQVQHRMRPEIADNIRHIYGTLHDHESVKSFENILGIEHNVFFINHSNDETNDPEIKGYANLYEADFVLALCSYLLLQGYDSSKITILTTYKGQLLLLHKVLKRDFKSVKDVRITTVDDYQGEENDIILLSLVRSNSEGRIGYLDEDTRVCVALSRARKGLYVIGNFDNLSKTTYLWKTIIIEMKKKSLCGDILKLSCQNHPNDNGIIIQSPNDFKKAPEGGCKKKCNIQLNCGHICEKICHTLNREHKDIECHKPCLKLCLYGHACQKQCFQACVCDIEVSILLKNCGHVLSMKCHQQENFDESTYECMKACNILLPCGHVCNRKCYEPCICMITVNKRVQPCNHENEIPCSINPKQFKCAKSCEKILSCSHPCLRKCGEECEPCTSVVHTVLSDCGHSQIVACVEDLSNVKCNFTCNQKMDCGHPCPIQCGEKQNTFSKGSMCPAGHTTFCDLVCKERLKCGHYCKGNCTVCHQGRWHRKCTESCYCILVCGHACNGICGLCLPCKNKCFRRCSHRVCLRPCNQVCEACQEPCVWQCRHYKCTKRCGESCDRERCYKPCRNVLKCGHYCIGMCGDPCPMLCRKCDVREFNKLVFRKENEKESRFVQLQDCGHIIRYDIMDEYMDRDGGCSIKYCPICQKPIRTSNGNRYEKVLNEFHLKLEELKIFVLGKLLVRDGIFRSVLAKTGRRMLPLSWCFTTDWLKNISEMNQLTVIIFITDMIQKNDWSVHDAKLFPPGQIVLTGAQDAEEIKREVRRYLDQCLLEKLHDNFLLSIAKKQSTEIISMTEAVIFKDAFSILNKKTAYTDYERKKLHKCIQQLSTVKGSKQLLNICIKPVNDGLCESQTMHGNSRCGLKRRYCGSSKPSFETNEPGSASHEPRNTVWYSIKNVRYELSQGEETTGNDLTSSNNLELCVLENNSRRRMDSENHTDITNEDIKRDHNITADKSEAFASLLDENIIYEVNMVTWHRPYYECEQSRCRSYSTCKSDTNQKAAKERKEGLTQKRHFTQTKEDEPVSKRSMNGLTKKRSSTHTMEDEPVPKRSREESKFCTRKKTGEELSNEKVRPKQQRMSSFDLLTEADKTNVLNKSLYYKERNMDIVISNNQNNNKEYYSVVREKQSDGLCKTSENYYAFLQNEDGVSELTNSVKHTTTIKSNDLRNVINRIHKRKEQDKQTGEAATSTKSRKVVNRTEKTHFSKHY